jgi:hypothetical protein
VEILMDLLNITIISFILLLLFLTPVFLKRLYHIRRSQKLLDEYRESCRQYRREEAERLSCSAKIVYLKEYRKKHERLL